MTNMPSNQTLSGVTVFIWLVGFAGPAWAGPVTWEFTGVVDTIMDNADLFGGAIEPGSLFTGNLTFDSETPESHSSSSSSTFQGAVTDIMIELGGGTVLGPTADFNRISIINDYFTSGFDNFGLSVSVMLGVEELGFGMQLRNSDGTMFDATTLPVMPPDIDLLGPSEASIVFSSSNELLHINGSITSIVPEPGTLTLVAVCAGLTCMQRRRRLRKARRSGTLVSSLFLAMRG